MIVMSCTIFYPPFGYAHYYDGFKCHDWIHKIGAFLLVTEEFPTVILWYKLADHK